MLQHGHVSIIFNYSLL